MAALSGQDFPATPDGCAEQILNIETAKVNQLPLVVDLDGTLIRSDVLVETGFAYLGQNPLRAGNLIASLRRSKAALKAEIASKVALDVAHLPYDQEVIAAIQTAKAAGAQVYLASASNETYVAQIATHLGLFDGHFGSNSEINLSSTKKADLLVQHFGQQGFDYIGNDSADLAVWAVARRKIGIRLPASAQRQLAMMQDVSYLPARTATLRDWLKLLRIHQWAKNALVFVTLVTAHTFNFGSIVHALAAFLAFSLAASGVYILNDLVDIEADRLHQSKKRRPLASGTVAILPALMVGPSLILAALLLALVTQPLFAAVLLVYLIATTAYTFSLKRKMMVDIVVLAGLYTIRVVGGAVAISVPITEWLLAFSMFMFTSLALIKRYVELASRIDADLPDPSNRNYRKSDLDIVAALAAASGFNAVTVFAMYISSESVHGLYRHPQFLWLICPVLMYWLGRALMMAHRRLMDDDPIIFALKDWNSGAAFGLIALFMLAAI